MKKEIITNSIEETIDLGNKIGKIIKPHSLITLSGDLGAGKTTFTKGIAKGMNIKRVINSPTFTICKLYDEKLAHFDAYRLEGQDDELGFEEIFDSEYVCVVEWANYIEDILPKERLEIEIKYISENKRKFILNPIGESYIKIVEELL